MRLTDDEAARTVISTRIINAEVDQVFDAYADPEKLVRWWVPNGFTLVTEHIDLQEGGDWRFVFTGPDGKEYKNYLVFKTIDRPRRFVVDHRSGPYYVGTVTFDDLGPQTRITMYWVFENADFLLKHRKVIEDGNEGNFDRVTEVVLGQR